MFRIYDRCDIVTLSESVEKPRCRDGQISGVPDLILG